MKKETANRQIEKIIYKWVGESYGTQEADDPSWNVGLLSKEIAKRLVGNKIKKKNKR